MNKKIILLALLIGAPHLTFTKGTPKKSGDRVLLCIAS